MLSFKEKESLFDAGKVRRADRRSEATSERREWFQIIGESIRGGFAEFLIATRFCFPTLNDVYTYWEQPASAIANDSKTVGELFEIYCLGKAKHNRISIRWLHGSFMPKYRPSVGEHLGLNDLYKTQFELFYDLSRTCNATGSPERIIESLNKFNARFERMEQGFVPTPTKTAERMVEMLADSITSDTVVIDPCCGRGIFLTSLRKRFGPDLRIYGIEKDVGKAYLAAAFFQPNSNSRYVGNVFCRDSLTIKNYDKEILKVAKRSGAVALADMVGADVQEPSRIVFVGNPPYHDFEGAFGSSPISIYQNFVERALDHGSEALFVIPARWYAAGRGLDDFRAHMTDNDKIKQMVDFPIASNVFPSVEIEGGVCFLHVSNTHFGYCKFTDVNGLVHPIDLTKYDIVVRDLSAHPILSKVLSQHTLFMSSVVSGGVPFGMRTNFKNFTKCQTTSTLPCLTKHGTVYVDRKYVTSGEHMIPQWKTICSNADGAANRIDLDGKKQVLTIIDTMQPGHVCLQTYLVVMATDSENESRNCTSYLKTKFARFLLGLRKVTQHLSKDKFKYVPKLDFALPWTDQKLYAHFKLTADEQAYIEATIRPSVTVPKMPVRTETKTRRFKPKPKPKQTPDNVNRYQD